MKPYCPNRQNQCINFSLRSRTSVNSKRKQEEQSYNLNIKTKHKNHNHNKYIPSLVLQEVSLQLNNNLKSFMQEPKQHMPSSSIQVQSKILRPRRRCYKPKMKNQVKSVFDKLNQIPWLSQINILTTYSQRKSKENNAHLLRVYQKH